LGDQSPTGEGGRLVESECRVRQRRSRRSSGPGPGSPVPKPPAHRASSPQRRTVQRQARRAHAPRNPPARRPLAGHPMAAQGNLRSQVSPAQLRHVAPQGLARPGAIPPRTHRPRAAVRGSGRRPGAHTRGRQRTRAVQTVCSSLGSTPAPAAAIPNALCAASPQRRLIRDGRRGIPPAGAVPCAPTGAANRSRLKRSPTDRVRTESGVEELTLDKPAQRRVGVARSERAASADGRTTRDAKRCLTTARTERRPSLGSRRARPGYAPTYPTMRCGRLRSASRTR
jgi:hypothetical protein